MIAAQLAKFREKKTFLVPVPRRFVLTRECPLERLLLALGHDHLSASDQEMERL